MDFLFKIFFLYIFSQIIQDIINLLINQSNTYILTIYKGFCKTVKLTSY